MDDYTNNSINPAVIHSRPRRRSSTNLNNNEIKEQLQHNDLTASIETIHAPPQSYLPFNGFGWSGGSNSITESGESSYPNSSYTGDTSLTSDNPEYRLSVSDMFPAHPEPGFSEMLDHHDRNTHRDPLNAVGVQFSYELPLNQNLDSDLNYHGDQNDTEEDSPSPVEGHQGFQEIGNTQSIGMPGRSDHSLRGPPQRALLQEMYVLGKTFQALNPETSNVVDRESLVQFRQGLGSLCQNVDTMLHNHEPKAIVAESLSEAPSGHDSMRKRQYQCRIPNCDSDTIFTKVETFRRHIESKHYNKVSYYCTWPGCGRSEARRDKMLAHSTGSHLIKPSRSEVDRKKKLMLCPQVCPICSILTRSWDEFYRCIIEHSLYDDAHGGLADSERAKEGNNNVGAAPGNIPSFPGAGEMATTQRQGGYGNRTSRRVSSSLLNPNHNPFGPDSTAHDMLRGFSEGINMPQAPPTELQGVQEGRRSSDSNLHPDVLQRPQQPPPPPRPQPQQPDLSLQEQLQCQVCRHLFNRCCRQQNPREWCHECAARMLGMGSQIPRAPTSNQRGPYNAIAPMYQPMRSFGPPVNVPFREVFYQPQQTPRQRPPGGRGTSFQGPSGNHYNVSMLTSIDVPGLIEDNMEILLNSKAANLPFGLPSFSRLPTRVPLLKGMVNVSTSASPIPLDYNVSGAAAQSQVDLPLTTIQDNQCQCPCRVKALERSYNKARVELAPGKVLDVNMKILADDRPSHLLRTRVRVVVKLLKLRSSVAQSSSKKKTEEEARAIKKALKTSLDVPEAESSSKFTTTKLIENIDDIDDPDGSDLDSDGTCSDTESVISSVSATSSISEFSVEAESKPGSPDVSGEPFPNEFNNFDDDSLPPSSFSDGTHDPNEMIPYHHEGCDHPFFTGEAEELFSDDLDDTSEETELEIALDLDLATCLSRLSILTDGLADFDQPGLDQKITDPNRIFEYFFRYILYVIVALSRSRKHGSPSFLE